MKLPDSMWTKDLGDGSNLLSKIGMIEPTWMPITDKSAFKNVWNQRLEDAKIYNHPDLRKKAKTILRFMEVHDEVFMLIWPSLKVTALFEPKREKIILLE